MSHLNTTSQSAVNTDQFVDAIRGLARTTGDLTITVNPASVTGGFGKLRSGTNDSSSPLAGGRSYLFGPAEGGGFLNDNSGFLAFSVSTTLEDHCPPRRRISGHFYWTNKWNTRRYTLMFAPNEFGVQDPSSNLLAGSYSGVSFSFSTISAVPEPSTWLLVSSAAFVLGTLKYGRHLRSARRRA